MRILMWLLLGVLVYFALRKNFKSQSGKNSPPESPWQSPVLDPEPQTHKAVEDMVCCQHCQIHIPASEAIVRDGAAYCCTEHAKVKDASGQADHLHGNP